MKALKYAFILLAILLAIAVVFAIVVLIAASAHGETFIGEIKSWFNKETVEEGTEAVIRLLRH